MTEECFKKATDKIRAQLDDITSGKIKLDSELNILFGLMVMADDSQDIAISIKAMITAMVLIARNVKELQHKQEELRQAHIAIVGDL